MQEYFKRVFGCDGVLRDDAEPAAVSHLRQVLFATYKLEVPYQKEEEQRVIDAFVQTDRSLVLDRGDDKLQPLLEAAAYIARDVLRGFDPKDILPRHGPGAVATGERLDGKWEFSRLYQSIHQQYPYYDYFVVGGPRELLDRLDWYKSLQRCESGTAKVVLVPKDSRGPRLISCEPLEYQWIQQGLGRKLSSHLEGHWLTGGRVNFTRQEINQQLALSSSMTDEFATLDLKDASDRVSLELVREVFQHRPDVLACLEACRTTATKLPDGQIVELRKFAPMGSALCFPVEAFVFWCLIVAAIHVENPREFTRLPHIYGKRVYVYGDDIIVPKDVAHVSIQALERAGLRVNTDKSCITGPFKESCGVDAFKGIQVTPIRVRTLWTGRRSDGAAYASYVETANHLRDRGYTDAYSFLKDLVEGTYGRVPVGTTTSSYPCWTMDDPYKVQEILLDSYKSRFNSDYQRFEFRLPMVKPRKIQTELDGWQRLLRNSVAGELTEPSVIVVPRSIQIKRGWTPVY
jgi:hypothetical protein